MASAAPADLTSLRIKQEESGCKSLKVAPLESLNPEQADQNDAQSNLYEKLCESAKPFSSYCGPSEESADLCDPNFDDCSGRPAVFPLKLPTSNTCLKQVEGPTFLRGGQHSLVHREWDISSESLPLAVLQTNRNYFVRRARAALFFKPVSAERQRSEH
jgi:hypothetical protein